MREAVGDRVKRRIRESGLDQGRLADSLGMSRGALNRALNGGTRSLDLDMLARIGAIVGFRVEDVVVDAEPPNEPPVVAAEDLVRAVRVMSQFVESYATIEHKRLDNERLRIQEEAATARLRIQAVEAYDAQDRAERGRAEYESQQAVRIAMERLAAISKIPHPAGRSEPPARRARAGAGA